jgi:hypothetical protein
MVPGKPINFPSRTAIIFERIPMKFRTLAVVFPVLALAACKLPEQKHGFYPNKYLKERFWVYQEGGREVMHGLYTGWHPNGEKEVEILYSDGAEVARTYFTERGTAMGTVHAANLRAP